MSYGTLTANCHDYTLDSLDIHHMGTDGIGLGFDPSVADRNVTIDNVECSHNARQGMSILQARGVKVSNSKLLDTGRTEGEYGQHSPSAGVDVEPGYAADGAIYPNFMSPDASTILDGCTILTKSVIVEPWTMRGATMVLLMPRHTVVVTTRSAGRLPVRRARLAARGALLSEPLRSGVDQDGWTARGVGDGLRPEPLPLGDPLPPPDRDRPERRRARPGDNRRSRSSHSAEASR